MSTYRGRQKGLTAFFNEEDNLAFCCDIVGLFNSLNINYKPEEWRLFIDASKASLKAVLLHNGNTLPSIPIGHAVDMKETYENMEKLLKCIKYYQYNWQLCGDLKVVAILLGLQLGYTKYCCFICEWDSRARTQHYVKKEWPERQSLEPGTKNVKHVPLVDPKKVLLPPLHIKLGLMKNFVKAMDKTGPAFRYLRDQFPKLSDAKIKEGVFVGPQIRRMVNSDDFEQLLTGPEKVAWNAFKMVVENFLGNNRAGNYKELVKNLLSA